MGAADIVPGVSGGTVALVVGIYERLITNVRAGAAVVGAVVRGRLAEVPARLREIEWLWIGALLVGIGAAILTLAHAIEVLLEEQPVRMAALFFGLIVGSVFLAWRLVSRRTTGRVLVAAGSAAAAFVVLGFRSGPVADPGPGLFLAAGAVAICAMILPGVSGSFLLLMLGMYDNVLGAVNDRDLVVLAAFGLGCVIGLAAFSTLLHWLLAHHHDTVMAALVGLMIGSLRVLWPWPDGTDTTAMGRPADDVVVPVLLIGVGIVVVLGVVELAERSAGAASARRLARR